MKRFIFLMVVSIIFSHCAEQGSKSLCGAGNPKLWMEPITTKLQVGNAVCNNGTGILFKKLVSDSRCPAGVDCIWQGEVRILLVVFSGPETISTFELTTKEHTNEVTISGKNHSIRFTATEPYPIAEKAIDPKKYIITLDVTPVTSSQIAN